MSYGYSVVSLLKGQRGLYFDSTTGIINFLLIGGYLVEKAKGKARKRSALQSVYLTQQLSSATQNSGTVV